MKIDGEMRRYAAVLGRRHLEGTVTLDALFEHFGDSDDPLIRAFLEAAAHQPNRGFAGVFQARWERDFWKPVSELLAELERGLDGRAPRTRVYPKSGYAGVLGWSVFTLFAGASAAEHAVRLWYLLQQPSLPLWRTLGNSLGFTVTAIATLGGLRTLLWRVHLFRTRDRPYGERDDDAG